MAHRSGFYLFGFPLGDPKQVFLARKAAGALILGPYFGARNWASSGKRQVKQSFLPILLGACGA